MTTRCDDVVIVGASLTGASVARTLREEGFDGTVTLVGDESHLPYERPPLSKAILRGEAPIESARVLQPGFFNEAQIEQRFGVLVLGARGSRAWTLTGSTCCGRSTT